MLPSQSFLQVFRKPSPIQNRQLAQHLIPVTVSLRPFLHYILAGQVQHLLQECVAGKNTFCLGGLPIMAVEPFYNVGGIHNPTDSIRELEEGAAIFLIVLPAADSTWAFLPPCLFHVFQFCKG